MLSFVLFLVFAAIAAAVLAACRFAYTHVDIGNQKRVKESVACYGAMVLLLFAAYGILGYLDHVGQPWTNIALAVLFLLVSFDVAGESLGLPIRERRLARA